MSNDIEVLLADYANAPVECDGFVRLAHTALTHAGVEHACFCGTLQRSGEGRSLPVHLWIELPSGQVIDYRARMWLGDDAAVPHGVFEKGDFPDWVYSGQEITVPMASDSLVSLLLMPIPKLV